VTLAEAAANGADLNLIGATFTKLTLTLDGSQAITTAAATDADDITASNQAGLTVDFDGNTSAIAVYNSAATAVTITELVLNASASTGSNTLDVSSASKANVTGGTGADAITGTAGADTISGGAGNDTITGGAGADTINVGTGTDNVIQLGTSSGSATFTNGTNAGNSATAIDAGDTWTLTGADVITGLSTGDTLTLPGTQAAAAVAVSGSTGLISTAVGTAGDYAFVRGTWTAGSTAGSGTFAYDAAGLDWLVQYDDDGQTALGNVDVLILVGTATSAVTGLVPTIG